MSDGSFSISLALTCVPSAERVGGLCLFSDMGVGGS